MKDNFAASVLALTIPPVLLLLMAYFFIPDERRVPAVITALILLLASILLLRKKMQARGERARCPPHEQALLTSRDLILTNHGVHGRKGYLKRWKEIESVFLTADALDAAENEEQARAYREAYEEGLWDKQAPHTYSADLTRKQARDACAIMERLGWSVKDHKLKSPPDQQWLNDAEYREYTRKEAPETQHS